MTSYSFFSEFSFLPLALQMLLFSDFGFWSYVSYLVIEKLALIYNWLPFHFLLPYPPFVCINVFLHHFTLLAPLIFRPHIKLCAQNKHTLSHLLCKSCLSPAVFLLYLLFIPSYFALCLSSFLITTGNPSFFSHLFLKLYFLCLLEPQNIPLQRI